MNNVDRKKQRHRGPHYVYVKGGFGTLTFGDAPYIAADIGYAYAMTR